MNIDESVFAYKLYEMEEQYGKLQCRIRTCERGGRDKIHSELEKAREEYAENSLLMEEKAKSCRSPAVTKLTQVQLDYRKKVDELKDRSYQIFIPMKAVRKRMRVRQECYMRSLLWILPRLPCSRH